MADFTVKGLLSLDISAMQKGVEVAKSLLEGFTSSAAKTGTTLNETAKASTSFENSLASAGNTLSSVGATITRTGLGITALNVALLGMAAPLAHMGAEWERSMTKIETLTGTSRIEVEKLSAGLLDMGSNVGKGPKELADALYFVSSNGVKGAAALDVVKLSAEAAAVGLGNTADISRAVVAAMNAYGNEALTAAHATDVMIATVRVGGAEAAELAGQLGRVMPIAAQMGVSFEEVGASIATFTRLGISSSEAVTALRGTLGAFEKGSKAGAAALAEYGLSFDSIRKSIKENGLADTLIDLNKIFKGNEEGLAHVIPNIRALTGVLANAGSQAQVYRDNLKEIENSHGDLDKAFVRTKETLSFQWDAMQAKMQQIEIEIGVKLIPAFMSIADAMMPAIRAVADLVEAFSTLPPWAQQITIFAALFSGPFVTALGLATEGVGALAVALGTSSSAGLAGALSLLPPVLAAVIGYKIGDWAQQNIPAIQNLDKALGDLIYKMDEAAKKRNPITGQDNPDYVDPTKSRIDPAILTAQIHAFMEAKKANDEFKATFDYTKELHGVELLTAGVTQETKKTSKSLADLATDRVVIDKKAESAHMEALKAELKASTDNDKAIQAEKEKLMKEGLAKSLAFAKEWTKEYEDNLKEELKLSTDNDKAIQDQKEKSAKEGLTKTLADIKAFWAHVDAMAKENSQSFSDLFSNLGDSIGGNLGKALSGFGQGFNLMMADIANNVKNGTAGSNQNFIHDLFGGNTDIASDLGVKTAMAFVQGAASVLKSTTPGSTAGIFPSIMAGFQAGMSTGNPAIAAAGAAAGGEFALGASGEIKRHFGTIGAIAAGIAFPVIGLGEVFTSVFGGSAKKAKEMRAEFIESAGGIDALMAHAQTAGVSLEGLFNIKGPQEMKTAIDGITAGLGQADLMAQQHEASINAVKDAMDRYGISVSEMGGKWAQQGLDEKAMGLLQDYSLLTAAGADHNLVIEKMGPALNTYVQESMRAGTTIPESMRPVLQAMVDAGTLTDAAGNKMNDLGGLTFAETLSQSVQTLVSKINDMIDALNRTPNINRDIVYHYKVDGGPPADAGGGTVHGNGGGGNNNNNDGEPMAHGGVSTGPTPAMLHGSPSNPELVGPADALARTIGQSIAASMGTGSGGGSNVFLMSEGGQLRQPSIAEVQRVQRMLDTGQISVPARAVSARG